LKAEIYTLLFLLFAYLPNSCSYSQNTDIQYDSLVIIREIQLSGNEKTNAQVIFRELKFQTGDTVLLNELKNKIDESKKNLLNLPLFNFVDILINFEDADAATIRVKLYERWYLWPQSGIYYADRNLSNWIKNKDFSRINVGFGLVKYNFLGRNQKLSIYSLFGYDNEYLLNYENIFLDKKRKHATGFYFRYLQKKETVYTVLNNRSEQIKLNETPLLKSLKFSGKYVFRNNFSVYHTFILAYEKRSVSDSLLYFNPYYLNENSDKAIEYLSASYSFKRDLRNIRVFPTKGSLFEMTVKKNGLNIFSEPDVSNFSVKLEISKYSLLNKRISIANHVTLNYKSERKHSFFLSSAVGYESNIRGYEYYVINGSDFFLTKHSLNFQLFPEHVFYLKKIPYPKFNKLLIKMYFGIFVDAAYVKNTDIYYSKTNNFTNCLLYSSGISLNLLSYYDVLLRVDYSVNHLKENGFYLHFEAPF
jgi:outer membrane protein assembly factor BamA